jgi:hypothetical protein
MNADSFIQSVPVATEPTPEEIAAEEQARTERIVDALSLHKRMRKLHWRMEERTRFPNKQRFDEWWDAQERKAAEEPLPSDSEVLTEAKPSTLGDKDPNFVKKGTDVGEDERRINALFEELPGYSFHVSNESAPNHEEPGE